MAVLTAESEGPFHTGPLALAANAYWWAGSRARFALDVGTARAARVQADILSDIADAGHPAIRAVAARRLWGLAPLIRTRFPEIDA